MNRFLACCAALLALSLGPLVQADSPWSTEEFLARQPDWERILGAPIKVEGRVLSANKQLLRLQKCDVVFHLEENHSARVTSTRHVELRGRLKKEDGKVVFQVDDLSPLPSDEAEFSSREARIKQPRSRDWYELAEWAAGRAKFYNDRKLREHALVAFRKGVEFEAQELPADKIPARFELADKAEEYEQQELADWLRFEASVLQSRQVLGRTPLQAAEIATAIKEIGRRLPGSGVQPEIPLTTLEAAFETDPFEAWRKATIAERRLLQRILMNRLQTARILMSAEADGRNGQEVAEEFRRSIPEDRAQAAAWDARHLAYRAARSGGLTRNELLSLIEDLTRQSGAEAARGAAEVWIKAREPRWREEGARGLVTLASERRGLLKDETGALALLIEADKQSPEQGEAAAQLQELGYHKVGGSWQRRAPEPDVSAAANAAADPLSIGQTETVLRQALGEPTLRNRVATARGVTESWVFGVRGSSRLVVVLQRRNQDAELKVTAFSTVR